MSVTDSHQNSLSAHWTICAMMFVLLIGYNAICHVYGEQIRVPIDESQRVIIRTVLYTIAIILFPLTNLMRHILLRLNQTMPGPRSASQRYLLTIVITQSMIESIGLFGPVMFVLGDDFNTLYIFSILGILGIFLHKPSDSDYNDIIDALSSRRHNSHP
jgi:hypothetical protein